MLVSIISASFYVVALCIAMTLIVPVSPNASRAVRIAHAVCGICGAAALAGALSSTVAGLWVTAGALFVATVGFIGIWLGLNIRSRDSGSDDGDENDDDGGSGRRRRPSPPAPTTPLGGPPADWSQFDRVRAAWEDSREPAGV